MIRKIDSFLIDYVFQPLSDKLARLISCYAIAAFLLTGALLIHIGTQVLLEWWAGLFMSSIWLPVRVWRAYEMESKPPSDILPVERIENQTWRVILLGLQILTLPMDAGDFLAGKYVNAALMGSWWLIVISYFFLACRRNPPKPRRARVPVNAVAQGAV